MSSYYSPSIEKLIEAFEKLPSIGNKTAARLAFYILECNVKKKQMNLLIGNYKCKKEFKILFEMF